MATEFLGDVRSELTSRATRTTLDELRKKGLEQVRVIRSSQILDLIEQAVDRALALRGGPAAPEERAGLLKDSAAIFREMLRSEMEKQQGAAQKSMDDLRTRLEQGSAELRNLEQRLAERDDQLVEAQARRAEVEAELRILRQRAEAGSSQDLLDELKALRRDIARPEPAAPRNAAPAASPVEPIAGAIEKRLESLGAELASKIERIGRHVGASAADEAPVEISGLFQAIPELEGNLDAVEAKERKGSDVSDALARMKSLRGSKPPA
jgi:chromosome segregation ATPase